MLESDNNFVEYGTPLEPIEEDEVAAKKPVSIQDQIAVDDQGRRRFHGAFTGGFSAGYYNTVGSKEGWTPKEFKSSRQNRIGGAGPAKKEQSVQDFMDEEDLGAFGIAPQVIRATNDFEQRENRKRIRPAQESDGPIPGIPVLDQIIQPVRDTIGIRILQRMGWRPGQGIGPRQSKDEKRLETERKKAKERSKFQRKSDTQDDQPLVVESDERSDGKVYGCFAPPEFRKLQEESDSDESIIDLENVTFAPNDFEDPLCNPKENTFGLGYTGLDRAALSFGAMDIFNDTRGIKSLVEKKKLNISGEAFGIGAFEDKDEEVYNRCDMSQYDFSLETPDERKDRRWKDREAKNQKTSEIGPETNTIAGFVKAKNRRRQQKFFPPPPIPKDFEPKHYIRLSRFNAPPPVAVQTEENKKLGLDRHRLTIDERQALLGEEKIPLTPQELQDQETKAKELEEVEKLNHAKERAERLKKFTEVLQSFNTSLPSSQEQSSMGNAFKPFMRNPEKQERYDKYLTLVAAGFKECLKDLQPIEMTEWEKERERTEFERASALYKPMGGTMSSRFVSAKSHDISHIVPMREVVQEKDPGQDPKVAAKMNLFGKLTRKIFEWHPDRLISKRFNVPHPYPNSKMVGVRSILTDSNVLLSASTTPSTVSSEGNMANVLKSASAETIPAKKSLFDNLDFSKPPPGLLPIPQRISLEEGICPPGMEDEYFANSQPTDEPTEIETGKGNIEVASVKPSTDLFKEIFEESSSDSEDEKNEPAKTGPSMDGNIRINKKENPSPTDAIERRASDPNIEKSRDFKLLQPKPKGIFDNLDFSKLLETGKSELTLNDLGNQRKTSEDDLQRRDRKLDAIQNKEIKSAKVEEDEENDKVYGPLPPASNPVLGNPSTSKDTKPIFVSKATRQSQPPLPISGQKLAFSTQTKDEAIWIEKGNLKKHTTHKIKDDDNEGTKADKTNKSHRRKKKKLKERSRSTSLKYKKSKKRKKDRTSKRKKNSKKRHEETSSDESSSSNNGNEDKLKRKATFSSSSSTSADESIQIHQSLNNRALLSKLRELTKSK